MRKRPVAWSVKNKKGLLLNQCSVWPFWATVETWQTSKEEELFSLCKLQEVHSQVMKTWLVISGDYTSTKTHFGMSYSMSSTFYKYFLLDNKHLAFFLKRNKSNKWQITKWIQGKNLMHRHNKRGKKRKPFFYFKEMPLVKSFHLHGWVAIFRLIYLV